jgi:hypothetical protein
MESLAIIGLISMKKKSTTNVESILNLMEIMSNRENEQESLKEHLSIKTPLLNFFKFDYEWYFPSEVQGKGTETFDNI